QRSLSNDLLFQPLAKPPTSGLDSAATARIENHRLGIRVHVAAQDDNLLVTTSGLEEVERVQEERTHVRNFLRTFEAEERGRILADSLEGRPYNSDEWRTIIKWNTPFTNQKTGADSDAQPRA